IGEAPTMPAHSAQAPPAILGTPKDPAPAVQAGRVMAPILAPRVYDEPDEETSTVDAADEATTVQPPIFVTTTPEPPPPALPPPVPAVVPTLRPAWLRYTIVALGIAIPLAVGFGTRSCGGRAAIGVMP